MRVTRRLAGLLLLAISVSAEARGEARRTIFVELDLSPTPFGNTFPDVGSIATRVVPLLADELEQRITFVDFAPREAADQTPALRIRVGCAGSNPPLFGACDIASTFTLAGKSLDANLSVTWRYREGVPFQQKCSGIEPEEFERQLQEELLARIRSGHGTLIQDLFSHLDLVDEALPIADEQLWILPISRADLRIDEGTVFEIRPQVPKFFDPPTCRTRSTVRIPSAGLPAPYDRGIQALIEAGALNEGCRRSQDHLDPTPLRAQVRIQSLVPRRGPVPPHE